VEIGFIHVSGKHYRPVLVFKFGEDGEPLDYTYFANSNQVAIIQQAQKLRMSSRIQIAAARKAENAEIEEDLRV
jgi:hypothetical protein